MGAEVYLHCPHQETCVIAITNDNEYKNNPDQGAIFFKQPQDPENDPRAYRCLPLDCKQKNGKEIRLCLSHSNEQVNELLTRNKVI